MQPDLCLRQFPAAAPPLFLSHWHTFHAVNYILLISLEVKTVQSRVGLCWSCVWAEEGERSRRKVIWSPLGVESLPCSSGLCVCLPGCLQRRSDPVWARHLSYFPSHLCSCHSRPVGEMMLSHRASVRCWKHGPVCSGDVYLNMFVFRAGGCVYTEHMLYSVCLPSGHHKLNRR